MKRFLFLCFILNFAHFFAVNAMQHSIEDILYQQMMKILDMNFAERAAKEAEQSDETAEAIEAARKAESDESSESKMADEAMQAIEKANRVEQENAEEKYAYNSVRSCFSDLLKEILKTKSGKLLISSILKEWKRPSNPEEVLLNREKVKRMIISGENKWAYNSSSSILKMPKSDKYNSNLQFAIMKDDVIQVEKIDPRVALFHELLHWYHELADIMVYAEAEISILVEDAAAEQIFWKHNLFPPFMAILQNQRCKTVIFQSYIEGEIASLEEASTIHGNGSFDFSKPRSALSENMFRLELGLGGRILYADIPVESSNSKFEERTGWITAINTQVSQVNSNLKSAETNFNKPLPTKGDIQKIKGLREASLNTAQKAHMDLHNFIRDIQMLCDIKTTGAVIVDRQIEDNIEYKGILKNENI
jgi:hypothetical protein